VYIVFGDGDIDVLGEKYLVLELDSFRVKDDVVPTYCIIDSASIDIGTIGTISSSKELHDELIKNYKKGDLKSCKDAIAHLRGKFNGALDSFYVIISDRINDIQAEDLTTWDGVIEMSQ
jgi:hypothetical protein